ncbi:MAG: hypothetical protein ASARMPRED_007972 [Alectoria sarmentosa]|nr:MAG: hypothetical protein ASARMPRED_007972 [Alectoria sarmentosa]
MNRHLVLGTGALSTIQQITAPVQLSRSLSSRTNTDNRNSSGDASSIREWLASFNNNVEMVPSSILKSKHESKVNSRSAPKVICRAPIDALRKCVPQEVLQRVQDSSHYTRGSDAVVTTSEEHMSTTARRDCIKKLRDILREIAENIISEASRKPPKQLPKCPPGKFSASEGRKRFEQQKRQQRLAKYHEKIARAREESKKASSPRN